MANRSRLLSASLTPGDWEAILNNPRFPEYIRRFVAVLHAKGNEPTIPSMTMKSYSYFQEEFRAICRSFGLPYALRSPDKGELWSHKRYHLVILEPR